ncbi:MAG TPA: hypothetical protein VGM92_15160 [Candidatus Kapabacteria bacterium]
MEEITDRDYEIFVREKIDKGINDIEKGRFLSEDEMKTILMEWIEK